ncbi:MAG: hypothetical protein RLZ45_303 [Verrucomicrobiota bacterium]|jgi:hypothetical protein
MENPSSPRETISQFERVLAGLASAGVDFAVVGGVAVILNGYARQTSDADILVHPSEDNIRCLLAHLETWGEGWARELRIEDFGAQEGCIRLMEEFELDLFTQLQGRTLDEFRADLRYLDSGSVRIPYLHPKHLIELKSGSWRDKDRLDVAALQEILRQGS